MIKMMSVLLSALLLLAPVAVAEEMVVEPIVGTVQEVREDGSLLVQALDSENQVIARVHEDTVIEADWEIGVGDVVIISYDGRMTRSLPGQINADIIRSFSMEGMVSEVNEEGNRLLIVSPEIGEVWATLPETEKAVDYEDALVRIYTNGVMALSFPGQVFALSVQKVEAVSGKVLEIGDDYFMLDDGANGLRVNFDTHTKVVGVFEEDGGVQVFYNGIMARSLPGQIYAMVVVPVELAE